MKIKTIDKKDLFEVMAKEFNCKVEEFFILSDADDKIIGAEIHTRGDT